MSSHTSANAICNNCFTRNTKTDQVCLYETICLMLTFCPIYTSKTVYNNLVSLQQSCPPVMAFHQGSLGFLTPFSFDNYQSQVSQVLDGMYMILLLTMGKSFSLSNDTVHIINNLVN